MIFQFNGNGSMGKFRLWMVALSLLSLLCGFQTERAYYSLDSMTPNQYLGKWLWCGPFPLASIEMMYQPAPTDSVKGDSVDFLESIGGELQAIPAEGTLLKLPELNIKRSWFFYKISDEVGELDSLFHSSDNYFAYAFCRIISPAEKNVRFSVGCTGAIKIIQNGNVIYERSSRPTMDLFWEEIRVQLVTSDNNFLIRLKKIDAELKFSFKFLNTEMNQGSIRTNSLQLINDSRYENRSVGKCTF